MNSILRNIFGISALEANELQDRLYDRYWHNQFPGDKFTQNLFRYTTIGRVYYLNHWERNDELFLNKFSISDLNDIKVLFNVYTKIQSGDSKMIDIYPNSMLFESAKKEYYNKFNEKVTL